MYDLGTLGGANSGADAINLNGQVVGGSYLIGDSTLHAFLYDDGVMQDLNSLIDPSAQWDLIEATAINDNGLIVGYGTNPAGQTHAFLLTPVPEPGALALLLSAAAGLPALVLLRRRLLARRISRASGDS